MACACAVATTRWLVRRALEIRANVARKADVQLMVRRTLAAYRRIDILATIAGTTSFGAGATLAEKEWDRVQAVNLKSVFLCIQAVIPAMRRQKHGRKGHIAPASAARRNSAQAMTGSGVTPSPRR